jgi:hypothetical protein
MQEKKGKQGIQQHQAFRFSALQARMLARRSRRNITFDYEVGV